MTGQYVWLECYPHEVNNMWCHNIKNLFPDERNNLLIYNHIPSCLYIDYFIDISINVAFQG